VSSGSEEKREGDSKRVNWLAIVGGAVITTVVGLVGAWAYGQITSLDTRVVYELTAAPPLFGTLEDSRAFTLSVENAGDRAVTNVRLGMSFRDASISETDVEAPAALRPDMAIDLPSPSSAVAVAPEMNPGDLVKLSVLVESGTDSDLADPEVDVRGEGVAGEPRAKDEGRGSTAFPEALLAILATASALGAAAASRITASRARSTVGLLRAVSGSSEPSIEPRAVLLARACLDLQLVDLAEYYMSIARSERWWMEADFLTEVALSDGDDRLDPATCIQLLSAIVRSVDWIAQSSLAVFHCNISRLQLETGDVEGATASLEKARSQSEATVEERLQAGRVRTP
jgi:hypothetical protein